MLVFFSGRHLKPGHWEQFREAWAPSDEDTAALPDGTVIYHARSIKDEDEVISFGIFDVDRESKDDDQGRRRIRGEAPGGDRTGTSRTSRSRGSTRWSRRFAHSAPSTRTQFC